MFENEIRKYLDETVSICSSIDTNSVEQLLTTLVRAHEENATIYIMGNGGSASTASHFVNDFNKGVSEELSHRFKFICLNDNVSSLMAIANDIGYDEVFRFQLKNFLQEKDVVIGISGSGNSPNVVNALIYAKSKGAFTVGLVGYDGGLIAKITDHIIHVPVCNMQHVEDFHLIVDHMMMTILKKYLES